MREQCKRKPRYQGGLSASPSLGKQVLISRMDIVALEMGPVGEGRVLFSPESSTADKCTQGLGFVLGKGGFWLLTCPVKAFNCFPW